MVKSGTSVTIERDLLKWVDGRVEERVYASRSHAFEYALTLLKKMEKSRGY